MRLDYNPGEYYENRLFNAAAAAEGFDTALFPDSTGLPPAAHESVVRRAAGALYYALKGASKLGHEHVGIPLSIGMLVATFAALTMASALLTICSRFGLFRSAPPASSRDEPVRARQPRCRTCRHPKC